MRASRLLARHALAIAIAIQGAIVAVPQSASAAAFNPTCPTRDLAGNPLPNSGLYQCVVLSTKGPRGSIYVVGDSVLLGSADGYSHPGLASMLQQNGWGPVALQATVGMRAWWDVLAHPAERFKRGSAAWMIDNWQSHGWKPATVAVNVGSNEIATCTRATVAKCRAQIEKALAAAGTGVQVWWSKMNFAVAGRSLPQYEGMRGWNLALDQAAAAHPNLVVWDWPTALANSNPKINTDGWGIHPSSKLEYVKRSRLIAAHITNFMPASHSGTASPTPTATASGLRFVPTERTTTGDDQFFDGDIGTSRTTVTVASTGLAAPGTSALVLNIATSGATSAGWLTTTSCASLDTATPGRLPRLPFSSAANSSTQVIVPVVDGTVCLRATTAVHVTIAAQGSLVGGPDASADAMAFTTSATALDAIPAATATADAVAVERSVSGAAVSVRLAAVGGDGTTSVWVNACGTARSAVPTLVVPPHVGASAVAYLSTGAGSLCVTRSNPSGNLPAVSLTATGTFAATGATFTAVTPTRMLDTRVVSGTSGIGGWYGRAVKGQKVSSTGAPIAAVTTGTVSVEAPTIGGTLATTNCTTPGTFAIGVAPLVNAAAAVSAPTSGSGAVCFVSTGAYTYVAFDLSGWWS